MKQDKEQQKIMDELVATWGKRREQDAEERRKRQEQVAEERRRVSVNKVARRFWALKRRAYTIDEYAVTISPSYVATALFYLFILSSGVVGGLLFLKDLINGELGGLATIFFIAWVIYWSYKAVTIVASAISEAQLGSVIHIDGASRAITQRPWLKATRSGQPRVIPFRDVAGVEVSYESRPIGEQEQLVWKLSLRLHNGQEIELGKAGGTWHKKGSSSRSPSEPRPIIELSEKITTLTGMPVIEQPRTDWWREAPK